MGLAKKQQSLPRLILIEMEKLILLTSLFYFSGGTLMEVLQIHQLILMVIKKLILLTFQSCSLTGLVKIVGISMKIKIKIYNV
jgi:hypothetical protein